jgi:hypothetical protein
MFLCDLAGLRILAPGGSDSPTHGMEDRLTISTPRKNGTEHCMVSDLSRQRQTSLDGGSNSTDIGPLPCGPEPKKKSEAFTL